MATFLFGGDSSREEEEEEDSGFFLDGGDESTMDNTTGASSSGLLLFGSNNGMADDDDDEEDSVDWEEAEEDEDDIISQQHQPNPVSIDLDAPPVDEAAAKKKKRKKRRSKYSFHSLSDNMKDCIDQLHQASWLALTSHVVFRSRQCSDPLAMAVAFSLIPSNQPWNATTNIVVEEGDYVIPTKTELKDFFAWFCDFVKHSERRRMERIRDNLHAGAPRPSRRQQKQTRNHLPFATSTTTISNRLVDYCAYLASSQMEDPQLFYDGTLRNTQWTPTDKVHLFLTMTRSLGWRTRAVSALEPISKTVDVHHPFLQNTKEAFQATELKGKENTRPPEKPKARKKKRKKMENTTSDNGLSYEMMALIDAFVNTRRDLDGWVEVLCQSNTKKRTGSNNKAGLKWIHVDPVLEVMDQPKVVETTLLPRIQNDRADGSAARAPSYPVSFVMAAEHLDQHGVQAHSMIADVTPRYASSIVKTLQLRGIPRKQHAQTLANQRDTWSSKAVEALNENSSLSKSRESCVIVDLATTEDDMKPKAKKQSPASTSSNSKEVSKDHNNTTQSLETEEFPATLASSSEAMPTSKDEFNNHPLYVIPSVLKSTEALTPGAKPIAFFKGQCVFHRYDVSQLMMAKKWLGQGRKVRESELGKPVKSVDKRAKPVSKRFKALKTYQPTAVVLEDEAPKKQDLYALWQTDPWSPSLIGPNDKLPVNEFRNIELELLNPGLAHVDEPGVAQVAKQLGIPYAPCLLGWEGRHDDRKPKIRGVVVHEHNAALLREASAEVAHKQQKDEEEQRRQELFGKWKRLLVGVLTEDRLEREYGSE